LSGGEKQRVAFARAVLREPKILVLDEATASLDTMTEHMIQESLADMRQQITRVIVAHRLSTIVDADAIVVLEHGCVVETGKHGDLVQRGGVYAAMWQRQQESGRDSEAAQHVMQPTAEAEAYPD
jgi:ABC-type transport system involved in Fe-S cluster assembly fused permease/ATPase subunit